MYKLSGDGRVLFTNTLFWPVTISLNVQKSVVTKYPIGTGFASQAPEDWSVTFFDEEDSEIGVHVQSGESFPLGDSRVSGQPGGVGLESCAHDYINTPQRRPGQHRDPRQRHGYDCSGSAKHTEIQLRPGHDRPVGSADRTGKLRV